MALTVKRVAWVPTVNHEQVTQLNASRTATLIGDLNELFISSWRRVSRTCRALPNFRSINKFASCTHLHSLYGQLASISTMTMHTPWKSGLRASTYTTII